MKKFLALLIIFVFFFSVYPVFAQDNNIGESRINPASPLYFLKGVREVVELKFTKTSGDKALLQLEFATRRIREVNSLAKTSRQDLIVPTIVRYLSNLESLTGVAYLGNVIFATKITDSVTTQMTFLQSVYSQISDSNARRSIRSTVNSLTGWDDKLILKLNEQKDDSLAQKVNDSRLSGCSFLSKEASASGINEVEKSILFERGQKCLNPK